MPGALVDKRTEARQLAMQALFQLDVQSDLTPQELQGFFEENAAEADIRRLARNWTEGAWQRAAECDELITAAAKSWKLNRLARVERSILRLAVYQLKFCTEIPPRVVINEAIELAKRFGAEQSPGFVNGVLDAVLKRLTTDT